MQFYERQGLFDLGGCGKAPKSFDRFYEEFRKKQAEQVALFYNYYKQSD